MAIDRKKILYSLCVDDVITTIEGELNINFNDFTEEQQEELINLGKQAFDRCIDSDIGLYEIEDFITNHCSKD